MNYLEIAAMKVFHPFYFRLRFFVLLSFVFCLSNTHLRAQDSLFVKLVGQYKPPGSVMGVDVKGNYAYVVSEFGGNDTLFVIDVSDPSNPVRVSERKTLGTLSIDVLGDYTYTGGNFIEVWDISDPLNPLQTDAVDVTGNALSIHASGSVVFITKSTKFLNLYDVSDPTNITIFSGSVFWGAGALNDVFADGALAYTVDKDSGMFVVDVGDPTNKIIVSKFRTPGVASGVFVAADHAYVADGANGLTIIDVTDPLIPIETGNKMDEILS